MVSRRVWRIHARSTMALMNGKFAPKTNTSQISLRRRQKGTASQQRKTYTYIQRRWPVRRQRKCPWFALTTSPKSSYWRIIIQISTTTLRTRPMLWWHKLQTTTRSMASPSLKYLQKMEHILTLPSWLTMDLWVMLLCHIPLLNHLATNSSPAMENCTGQWHRLD
jgi:hypothetical protein